MASASREPKGGAVHRIKGRDLWYRDVGAGNPVVLVHGVGAAHHVWDALVEAESESYRFIAIDLPNTGRSRDYAKARSEDVSNAIVELLDALKVPRAVMAGHSFGGVIGIDFAARHPTRLSGLLVMSAPAVGLPGNLRALLDAPASEWAVKMLARLPNFRSMVKTYLAMAWGDPKKLSDARVDRYLESMKAEGFYPALLDALRDVARFVIPVEALKKNRVPALVLWGDKDRVVPVTQGEQVAMALGADLTVLHGIGHAVPEEDPVSVAEAIARLADHPKKSRSAK